ncbi:hypothetical protein [Streptomyces wedmorensis]
MLDSAVWHIPLPAADIPLPDPTLTGTDNWGGRPSGREEQRGGEEHRFGPGVPRAGDLAIPDQAAQTWRSVERPDQPGTGSRHRRRLGRWLFPILVLLAVLAFLDWQRWAGPVSVTGVAVRTDPKGPGCDGTAVITGTLQTNGAPGTVTYRWRRSDGTLSAVLRQQVDAGTRQTDVVLQWIFNGHGTLHAAATLEVLAPEPLTAHTSFTYTCR